VLFRAETTARVKPSSSIADGAFTLIITLSASSPRLAAATSKAFVRFLRKLRSLTCSIRVGAGLMFVAILLPALDPVTVALGMVGKVIPPALVPAKPEPALPDPAPFAAAAICSCLC
jgi:hypothetical protein